MRLIASDRNEEVVGAGLNSHTGQNHFTYRPALDGLRALAVYLVVGFHAGWYRLEGGFVGVDLFFLLSGFLITSVLLTEHHSTGRIQIAQFYSRRFRRLLPAALVAIVGSSLLSTLVFSEVARISWVGDARASLLYVSNWFFIGEATDYFAETVDQSPFLHFWSLSIEEQFYLGFPVLLIAILAASKRLRHITPQLLILMLTLLSLGFQVFRAASSPVHAYYGTEARLYQIAAGALIAVGLASLRTRRLVPVVPGLAFVGLFGLLAISTNMIETSPSVRGIAATFASACLVLGLEASPNGLLSRGFSIAPMVYLGRVSYSTYLWHWPVILLVTAVLKLGDLEAFVISAFVATSVAALSYQVLETPIREWQWLADKPRVTVGIGVLASVIAAGVVVPAILHSERKPVDLARASAPVPVGQMADVTFDPNSPVPADFDRGSDHGVAGTPSRDEMHCELGPSTDCLIHVGGGPNIMLVGDSHALRLVPAFLQLAREHDFSFAVSAVASCRWQVGLAPEDHRANECYSMRDDLYGRLLNEIEPDLVVAVSVGLEPVGVRDPALESLSLTELIGQVTRQSLDEMLKHAEEVLLLEPLPISEFDVKSCLSGARVIGECMFAFGEGVSAPRSYSAMYSRVYRSIALTDARVTSASYDRLICPNGSPCYPFEDGFSTMDDYHHVNPVQAVEHRDRIWAIIEPIIRRLDP